MDLGGPTPGVDHDQVIARRPLTVKVPWDELTLRYPAGASPAQPGDTFDIILCNSISGVFNSVTFPDDQDWFIDYAGDRVTVGINAPACDADLDNDGDTDVFDFSTMAANFGAGPDATFQMGDLNADGFVDVFDFAELTAEFGCDSD